MGSKSIITPEQLARAYANAIKNEERRETYAKRNAPPIYSLDDLPPDLNEGHEWESDNGAAVERMLDEIDGAQAPINRERAIERARFIVRQHCPECLDVFWLVLKNGENRKESIWELVKKATRNGKRRGSDTTAKSHA